MLQQSLVIFSDPNSGIQGYVSFRKTLEGEGVNLCFQVSLPFPLLLFYPHAPQFGVFFLFIHVFKGITMCGMNLGSSALIYQMVTMAGRHTMLHHRNLVLAS